MPLVGGDRAVEPPLRQVPRRLLGGANPNAPTSPAAQAAALSRGIAVYPMAGTIDGTLGEHLIVAPSYIAPAVDIATIVDRRGEAVDAAVGRGQ
ncbi:MAG TPA: hypothetical protein VJY39_02995 [Acidisphaera sp.]|nr:hypothetical protein [Acidisphaera sp.]